MAKKKKEDGATSGEGKYLTLMDESAKITEESVDEFVNGIVNLFLDISIGKEYTNEEFSNVVEDIKGKMQTAVLSGALTQLFSMPRSFKRFWAHMIDYDPKGYVRKRADEYKKTESKETKKADKKGK